MKKMLVLTAIIAVLSIMFCGCGNGESSSSETIADKNSVFSGEKIISFSMHGDTAFALKEDGTLWGWGDNTYYNLGNGFNADFSGIQMSPQQILENVKTFALGYNFGIALMEDGSLWAWGVNDCGQVGNGGVGDTTIDNRLCQSVPVKVMDEVDRIYTGDDYAAAIKKDNSLWMWGNNEEGLIGIGTCGEGVYQSTPIKVLDEVDFIVTSAYRVAAVKIDGSLWVWGDNGMGQLGTGKTLTVNRATSFEDSYYPEKILDNVKSVMLGSEVSAAIQKNGALLMWGSDATGIKGSPTPTFIASGIEKVWDISYFAKAALTTDGELLMWGVDSYGAFGTGTMNDTYLPTIVLSDVKNAYPREMFTLVIKNDGSLWACGCDFEGALGIGRGDVNDTYSYGQIGEEAYFTEYVKIMDDVKDVYIADNGTRSFRIYALKQDNSLLTWGNYRDGLSVPNDGTITKLLDNVETIPYCSWHNVAAIKMDGSLVMWGSNYRGSLGIGSDEEVYSPVQVFK